MFHNVWFLLFLVDRSASATTFRRVTPPREDQSMGIDDGKCCMVSEILL